MLRISRKLCRLPTQGALNHRLLRRYLGDVAGEVNSQTLLENDEVRDVVDRLHSEIRARDNGYIEVKRCGLCPKANKDKIDNLWKLNIRPDGSYYCFRCSVGGSFQELKLKVNKFAANESTSSSQSHHQQEIPEIEPENKKNKSVYPHQSIMHKYHSNLFPSTSDKTQQPEHFKTAKEYLNKVRGLDDAVLKRYQVGYAIQQFLSDEGEWVDHVCITFPTMCRVKEISDIKSLNFQVLDKSSAASAKKPIVIDDEEFFIQKVKYRSITNKGHQRVQPKGGVWGLFGWHTVPPLSSTSSSSATTTINPTPTPNSSSPAVPSAAPAKTRAKDPYSNALIITEGEYDCMAVASALSKHKKLKDVPVVSLPNGCSSFPSDLIPLLERFDSVFIYMDYDSSGQQGAEKIIKKLGSGRCYLVTPLPTPTPPPKDANDALRMYGADYIAQCILKSRQLEHKHIESFSSLRAQITQYIHRIQQQGDGQEGVVVEGTETTSLPPLTEITKGFRRGELVVLSGPTGCGKTTLLSQLSLDFAAQGALTLWGSFEVRNTQLLLKMLKQYYKSPTPLFSLPTAELNQVLDDFEGLPLLFMNFYGATSIDTILDAMEYTVDKDDVQHIILDNLQFLLPRTATKSSFEKYDYQDLVIEKFRRFCTLKNVNIILVVHPRKEEDESILGLSSIGGSAKASQEADLVLLLQKTNSQMYLDVRKNRYDGTLGRIGLRYLPETNSFAHTTVDTTGGNFFTTNPYGSDSGGAGGGSGAGGSGGSAVSDRDRRRVGKIGKNKRVTGTP